MDPVPMWLAVKEYKKVGVKASGTRCLICSIYSK